MNWIDLISSERFGKEGTSKPDVERRTQFQRDYDRLIFSAAFRRMQNKTQVFPLPGSIFVHNRLTHSLEVASVGRSLGNDVGERLVEKYIRLRPDLTHRHNPRFESLGDIVSAACLAHDMGNPPFGHSGENAIRTFFTETKAQSLRHHFSDQQWSDMAHFDGNANTLRLLSHQFEGRRPGGFVMTYPTLASIVKYPYSSTLATKSKFGFFASEQEGYCRIASKLGIPIVRQTDNGIEFARHPLVYLVEAADDICYEIMDIEDAFKLRILSFEETCDLLLDFFDEDTRHEITTTDREDSDRNDRIVFFRACVINLLERECVRIFMEHEEEILAGSFEGSLISHLPERQLHAYKHCSEVAKQRIYNCKEVTDIDLAGFHIIYTLLNLMVDAVMSPEKAYSKLLISQASSQYALQKGPIAERIISVVDYLTGMTAVFALDLYRKIEGHSLPVV